MTPSRASAGASESKASAASADEATFARILVPVDFGPGSRRALGVALALQNRFGSEVHLFHLAEQGENDAFLAGIGGDALRPSDLVGDAENRLRRFVDNQHPGRSAGVIVHAREGEGVAVANSIALEAKQLGVTLVLLGAPQKQSMFRTHLEKLVRGLDSAVMLLWTPAEDALPA
jgi:nucleotide-binding universal stress UspA family protein